MEPGIHVPMDPEDGVSGGERDVAKGIGSWTNDAFKGKVRVACYVL